MTQYANLKTMTVEADLYGRDLKRVDLGGHVSTLSYDRAGRLTREAVSYGGKGVGDDYAWLNTGRLGGVVRTWRSGDGALHRQNAVYRYDAAGNKTYENTVETVGGAARTIQNQGASYDALGRMTSWSQGGDGPPRASTDFAYDANGNVRRTYTQYRPLDAQGNPAGSASYRDYYYAFDSMNRLVTDKGQLVGGAIRRGWTGTDYLYDVAGQRVRAVNTAWREAHYQVYGDQRAAPPPPPDQAAAQAGADTDNEAALLLAQIAAETLAEETLAAQASAAGLAATDGAALAIADDDGAEYGADDGAAPAGLVETAAVPDEATLLRLAALRAEAEAPTETGAQAPDAQDPGAQAPDAQDPGAQGGAFAPGPEADRVWVPGEDPADTEIWPDLPPTLADARPLPGNPLPAETPGNPLPAETPGTPVDAETPDIPPYAAPLDAAPLYAAPLDAAPLYAAPEAAMSPASLAGDPPPADPGTDPQGTDPGTDPQGYVPPPTLPDPGDGDGWHVASDWYEAEVRESYGYDAAGNLVSVRVAASGYEDNHDGSYTVTPPPGTGVLRAGYGYDRLGRQTTQIDYEANGTSVAYQKKTTWNGKGQAVYEAVITARADGVTRSDTTYSFVKPDGSGYALGAPVLAETANWKAAPGATGMIVQPSSRTETDYVWFDGARASAVRYRADTSKPAVFTTAYDYGIDGDLGGITVNDGRPRSISYVTDVNRQIVARDESDSSAATVGDPHEIWYRFNGVEMGYTGNNGTGTSAQVAGITSEYAASIADRQRGEPSPTSQGGAFRLGHANGAADFEQSSAPITSYDQGSAAGEYTVRGGDTLAGIAAGLWGDASLWYKLAEANPGTAAGALTAGQRLRLPSGVLRATFNASTFTPYDPANGIGDVQPTTPQPQRAGHKKGCGGLGTIFIAVVAVAVTVVTAGAALAALTPGLSFASGVSTVLGASVLGGTVTSGLGAAVIAGGVIGGAVGSIASQAVGVATGIQEKFSWKGVALSALSGGVGAGLGGVKAFGQLGVVGGGAARGALGSALTQGIAAATGLQGKFDWAGVAAAGVGGGASAGAGSAIGNRLGRFGGELVSGGAGAIANAATRSSIEGSSFGDNIRAAIPDVIGQALGNAVARGIASASAGRSAAIERAAGDPKQASGGRTLLDDYVFDPQSEYANLAGPINWNDIGLEPESRITFAEYSGAISHERSVGLQAQFSAAKIAIDQALMANGTVGGGPEPLGNSPLAALPTVDAGAAFTHAIIDARVAAYEAGYASGDYNPFAREAYLQSAADRHAYVDILNNLATAQLADDGAFVGRNWLTTASFAAGGFGMVAGAADTGIGIYNGEITPSDLATGSIMSLATRGLGRLGKFATETNGGRTNFDVYEVLSEQPISGASRSAHRASANRSLYLELQAQPELARMFDTELNANVLNHMSSGRNLLNPPGTVWHHPVENPNVVHLLRKTEHTNPLIQPTLHPKGVGGYGTYYGN